MQDLAEVPDLQLSTCLLIKLQKMILEAAQLTMQHNKHLWFKMWSAHYI